MRHIYYAPRFPLGGLLFGIVGIIFWMIVVWAIIAFFRHGNGHDWRGHAHDEDPIAILKTRYAKGEIDKEEFEKLKKDLG